MASKVNALQAWCKMQCKGYRDVEVTNMTTSWKSGLAFCAIIHRYHPELIDYDSLNKVNIYENNKLAFDVAATLGVSPYLDPEDMVAMRVPDKLSILTYVSQYYNVFGKQKPKQHNSTSVKRPADRSIELESENSKKTKPALNEVKGVKSATRTFASAEEICHFCKSKVYLMERHFDNNHLYHRSCFRDLERMQAKQMSSEHSNDTNTEDKTNLGQPKPEIIFKEKDSKLEEKDLKSEEKDSKLREKDSKLEEKDLKSEDKDSKLREKDSKLREKDSKLREKDSKLEEKDSKLREKDSKLREKDSKLEEKDSKLNEIKMKLEDIEKKPTNIISNNKTEKLNNVSEKWKINSVPTLTPEVEAEENCNNEPMEVSISHDGNLRVEGNENHNNIKQDPLSKNNATPKPSEANYSRPGSEATVYKDENIRLTPKLSYSDTLVEMSKSQAIKLSQVIRQSYDRRQMTSERQAEEKINKNHSFAIVGDALNSNNKDEDSKSTDAESSGSDSTLKSVSSQSTILINNKKPNTISSNKHSNHPAAPVTEEMNINIKQNSLNQDYPALSESFTITLKPQDGSLKDLSTNTSTPIVQVVGISTHSKIVDRCPKQVSLNTSEATGVRMIAKLPGSTDESHQKVPPPKVNVQSQPTLPPSSVVPKKPNRSYQDKVTKSSSFASKPEPISSFATPGQLSTTGVTTLPANIPQVPRVPLRHSQLYKNYQTLHLEGPEIGRFPNEDVGKKESNDNSKISTPEVPSSIACSSEVRVTPVPKPRNVNLTARHSIGGQSSSDMSIFQDKSTISPHPVPSQHSKLVNKSSRSPPPRPPLPVVVQTTVVSSSSAVLLPTNLPAKKWNEVSVRNKDVPQKDPLKTPPVKPPRSSMLIQPAPQRPQEMPDPKRALQVPISKLGEGQKPSQISNHLTSSTENHPLGESNHPPPRPKDPPSRKKLIPQFKFKFESVEFDDDPEPKTTDKRDVLKQDGLNNLKLIDNKLKKLETEGRILEQIIRNGEADSMSDVHMTKWFNMINDRNELVREETDLVYRLKQLDLEKEQESIEAILRTLMSISETQKTSAQKTKEEMLLGRLLDIVGKRSNIVDNQEDDRIRYLKEDEALKRTREMSLEKKKEKEYHRK